MSHVFKTSNNARIGNGRAGPGRPRGTQNKVTTSFKDAVKLVYQDIGGHTAFASWARENPTDFYKICSRLIPSEVNVKGESALTVIVNRGVSIQPTPEPLQLLPALSNSKEH